MTCNLPLECNKPMNIHKNWYKPISAELKFLIFGHFGTLDTYIWHIYSFILSFIKPKLIYTMRVNDRRLSEGEIKFYTSKYGITNY